jgi:hypothetical protein
MMRKGIVAVLSLAALLLVPLSANGKAGSTGAESLRGAGGAFEISFTLKSRDGEPIALRRFRFSHLEATCAGGATVQVRGRIRRIPVNDRNRFSKTVRRDGKRVKVRGRVSGDLDTVRGTIRARGAFGTATSCDSGRVRWRAS